MAYDEDLAGRVRELLAAEVDLDERRMFGGLAFLLGGNMAVAASSRGGLMVRVDRAEVAALIEADGVEPMEMRGRSMGGWLHVESGAIRTGRQLSRWVERGARTARALPPKPPRRR
ncbi:MAG: TfoX/Sxy family protein [Acidimicrobiia bacterium]